jgi:hypothetical protein
MAGTSSIAERYAKFKRSVEELPNTKAKHKRPVGRPRAPRVQAKLPPTPEQAEAARQLALETQRERGEHFDTIVAQVLVDLGANQSEAKRQLARAFAALCIQSHDLERRLLNGGKVDPRRQTEVVNAMLRTAAKLGVEPAKAAGSTGTSLSGYLAAGAPAEVAAVAEVEAAGEVVEIDEQTPTERRRRQPLVGAAVVGADKSLSRGAPMSPIFRFRILSTMRGSRVSSWETSAPGVPGSWGERRDQGVECLHCCPW